MNIILFFDFNINRDPRLVEEAARLGYAGLTLFKGDNNRQSPEEIDYEALGDRYSIKIYGGALIQAKNPEDMKQKVKKSRKYADIVMVRGGDQKINRAACEDPRVDILSKPYFKRRDCGINHVIARKAGENRVAVELNIKHLTKTNPYLHYKVLAQFREILKLKRKYDFPVIITSDAESIYDLHTPKDLLAMSRCFGMDQGDAEEALSSVPREIIERNAIRGKVIVEGVKLVD